MALSDPRHVGRAGLAPDGAEASSQRRLAPLTPAPDRVLHSGGQPRGLKTVQGMLLFTRVSQRLYLLLLLFPSLFPLRLFLQGLHSAQAQGHLLVAVNGTPWECPSPHVLLFLNTSRSVQCSFPSSGVLMGFEMLPGHFCLQLAGTLIASAWSFIYSSLYSYHINKCPSSM